MFEIKNNEKRIRSHLEGLSASEIPVKISGASEKLVVSDGAKTKRYSAKRDLYARSPNGSRLKMTEKALSLSGASSEKQKESSLVQRKSERQAIFKFTLSSASGGAGGGKYNRISAFVLMPVLLIRRSLKFFKKNFRDDSLFMASPKDSLHRHPERSEGSIKNNIKDWILHFANAPLKMTIPVFALIFTIATTAESRADDENLCLVYAGATAVPCIDKLTDENGNNSCGDNCTFKVIEENGKQVLHIYKEDISKPATILYGAFSPKRYKGNQVLDANGNALPLNNIMLDNDFENLGSFVFAFSGAQISSASGKLVFNNSSGYNAFMGSTVNADVILNNSSTQALETGTLNGDIVISDGIKFIRQYAFTDLTLNGNLIIPSSVERVFKNGLLGNINGKIYCASGVEKCYDMLKSACEDKESCLNTIKKRYLEKLSAYPDGCEKLEANLKCTKCKNASFKLEDDGWCLRKIYTPAEAAEVLKDDNTNSVTITFKK